MNLSVIELQNISGGDSNLKYAFSLFFRKIHIRILMFILFEDE